MNKTEGSGDLNRSATVKKSKA